MLKPFLTVFVSGAVLGLGAVYGVQNFVQAGQSGAPDSSSLSQVICEGVIQDRIDYTATFSPEDDSFTSIEFRPRTSDRSLSAALEPAGRDDQGRDVWRGVSGSAAQAEVQLVRLATDVSPDGNLIDVGYDGQWGRGVCR